MQQLVQAISWRDNGTPPWISSWEFHDNFRYGYGLDQMRKWLRLKESEIARRNYIFLNNLVSDQFHFIVCLGTWKLKL